MCLPEEAGLVHVEQSDGSADTALAVRSRSRRGTVPAPSGWSRLTAARLKARRGGPRVTSTDHILAGVGLIVAPAAGSQALASRLTGRR